MRHNTAKKIVITGGTSGLGLETSKLLLREGHTVCVTGRNFIDAGSDSGNFYFFRADFSEFEEVRSVVKKITDKIGIPDIIINNAGILSPPDFKMTGNGYEQSFQVNLLSHLLFNELFIRQSDKDDEVLIVSVTSPVYRLVKPQYKIPERDNYSPLKAYSESKYHLMISGIYLQELHPDRSIDYMVFNPGTFRSGIYRMQKKYFHSLYKTAAPFMKSPEKVAKKLVSVLNEPELYTGKIYRSERMIKNLSDLKNEKSVDFFHRCFKSFSDYLSQD
jgi:NAD(P)-dependent dehydrogenase (short-subunit alcohol dehydrogenase family)